MLQHMWRAISSKRDVVKFSPQWGAYLWEFPTLLLRWNIVPSWFSSPSRRFGVRQRALFPLVLGKWWWIRVLRARRFPFPTVASFPWNCVPFLRAQLCQGTRHCAPYEPAQGGVAFQCRWTRKWLHIFPFLVSKWNKVGASHRHLRKRSPQFLSVRDQPYCAACDRYRWELRWEWCDSADSFRPANPCCGAVRVAPHSVPALCQTVFLRPQCHSATTPKCRIWDFVPPFQS